MSEESGRETAEEPTEVAYLRTTPAETILGNHLFVLVQLAALRLSASPPDLEAARLVIDATAAVVSALGDRLGEHADLYRQALAEVQQAYVRAAVPPSTPDEAPGG